MSGKDSRNTQPEFDTQSTLVIEVSRREYMRSKRLVVSMSLLSVIALGVGLTIAYHRSHVHLGNTVTSATSQSPRFVVTSIHSPYVYSTNLVVPENLSCVTTTCLLTTTNATGSNSTLWIRQQPQTTFTPIPLFSGSRQLITGTACQNTNTCFVIVAHNPSGVDAQLYSTKNAGGSWTALTFGQQFIPTSINCLPNGPCWVSGSTKGKPEVFASIQPGVSWNMVTLVSEPQGAANYIACATVQNCIDVVGLPGAMVGSEEVVHGGLGGGLTAVLSSPQTQPSDQASCDVTNCYFTQAFGPQAGRQILITSIADSGAVKTLQTTTQPGTFVQRLVCSSTHCLVAAKTQQSTIEIFSIGSSLTVAQTPKGLSVDSPSLECSDASPLCLLTLNRMGLGLGSNYLTELYTNHLQLGTPLELPSNTKTVFVPYNSQLASCIDNTCYEVVETTAQLKLLALDLNHDRVERSFSINDKSVGVGLLEPVAIDCPSQTACKLVVQIGDGAYQLLSVNPVSAQTKITSLPNGISPQSLACSSSHDCIVVVAGISHHHGFPALWSTNGGENWQRAHATNAVNDLSSNEVTCQRNGTCLAIGQHDFVGGYGMLRPFVALSTDHGENWHLVKLKGPLPYNLPEPALDSITCSQAGTCTGVVATNQATLLLNGNSKSSPWTVQVLHLHGLSQNASPYAASIACGTTNCLTTLTFNPETPNTGISPRFSVQSLVLGAGEHASPIVVGKLPVSGILVATHNSHRYLEISPSALVWVSVVRQ